jgi:hypothetical protein
MIAKIDRAFGEHFLTSIDDFYAYGVDKLFNDWWATAPADAIHKYVDAIENHPEQAPLARERWYAEPFDLASLAQYGPGTLGHAYHGFMVSNDLMERLAQGYREFHEQLEALGKLDAMPPAMKYKVLRGFQNARPAPCSDRLSRDTVRRTRASGLSTGTDGLSLFCNVDCRHHRAYGADRSVDDQTGHGRDHRRMGLWSTGPKHSVR